MAEPEAVRGGKEFGSLERVAVQADLDSGDPGGAVVPGEPVDREVPAGRPSIRVTMDLSRIRPMALAVWRTPEGVSVPRTVT